MADTPLPKQPVEGYVQRMGEAAQEIASSTGYHLTKPSGLPMWWGALGWILVVFLVLTR